MLDEPLGLTVHSLPRPQDALEGDGRRTRMGRLEDAGRAGGLRRAGGGLLLHLLRGPSGGPAQLRRTGRAAAALACAHRDSARRQGGAAARVAAASGSWSAWRAGPATRLAKTTCICSASCARAWARTRTGWTGSGWCLMALPLRSSLLPALAQATVLRVDGAQLGQWLAPAPGQQLADHLYLVDPMGNWMMRFPAIRRARSTPARPRTSSATWNVCCAPRLPGTGPAATPPDHGRTAALRPVTRACA